jgi:hypothetical protein
MGNSLTYYKKIDPNTLFLGEFKSALATICKSRDIDDDLLIKYLDVLALKTGTVNHYNHFVLYWVIMSKFKYRVVALTKILSIYKFDLSRSVANSGGNIITDIIHQEVDPVIYGKLLEYGADINAIDESSCKPMTALDYLTENKNINNPKINKLYNFLKKNGAKSANEARKLYLFIE